MDFLGAGPDGETQHQGKPEALPSSIARRRPAATSRHSFEPGYFYEFIWNATSLPAGCSDLPGSSMKHCDLGGTSKRYTGRDHWRNPKLGNKHSR
jgi:hypothetical protein